MKANALKQKILLQRPTHQLLNTLAQIHEYKGRELFYQKYCPGTLKALERQAAQESVEHFHKGIEASQEEKEGYRFLLKQIYQKGKEMSLNASLLLRFFRKLYELTPKQREGWKRENNAVSIPYRGRRWILLKGTPPELVRAEVIQLHLELRDVRAKKEIEPIMLMATYLFDLFAIHPFSDGNGRICRLLMHLLLCQEGFHIGRYVSLERLIEKTQRDYYVSLYHCTRRRNDLLPWWDYVAQVLLTAYQELELQCGRLKKERRVSR